ncbi:LysR family transcriptional regulator [Piscinibacter terrae]|uniref:LysR family transcriptional regulator n=1 Tax=Piscinibacter terrae TaxID=2496871 RepID=A0A3N7JZK4_9BURK|nr:LysR family transcriptional regulator [Albitalea terrae]RQP26209.1 LysR family transcriptional regulator [Albitalea terrae]
MPGSDVRFPSIDGLRAFECTARLGSFERAADELDITASAVSKRVATLEELLGTALFTRSGRVLSLTAAGKEYLAQTSNALAMLAAIPLHSRAAQKTQRLRVRTPPTFARQILVPHLESFTLAHPGVELEIVLSIPYLDAGTVDADVEVRNGETNDPLMHDVVLPVASPALLSRLPPMREPADLSHAPLLRTPLEPWTPWFRAAGLDWPEPSQGPRFVDLGLTLEAAVSGQGVALARPTLAASWLKAGVLVPLLGITTRPAGLYHLVPHAPSDAAQAFADWLRPLCAKLSEEALAALSGNA